MRTGRAAGHLQRQHGGAGAGQSLVYNQLIAQNDMQVRRDTFGARLAYEFNPAVGVDVAFQSYSRTGEMPWDASFAFNNVNELPLPIDSVTTN